MSAADGDESPVTFPSPHNNFADLLSRPGLYVELGTGKVGFCPGMMEMGGGGVEWYVRVRCAELSFHVWIHRGQRCRGHLTG